MRLNEIKVNDYTQKVATIIAKMAGPWISSVGYEFGFRGIRTRGVSKANTPYIMTRPREDRRPMSTSVARTKVFNEAIRKSGLVANRSNSFFITGSESVATDYGQVWPFIALGEFNYTWSPYAKDWTYDFESTIGLVSKLKKAGIKERQIPEELRYKSFSLENYALELWPNSDEVTSMLALLIRGDDGSLGDALASGHEIMIKPKYGLFINDGFVDLFSALNLAREMK